MMDTINNRVDRLDPKFNCTLEIFAAAKNLPIAFLRDLGLSTVANPWHGDRLALQIPYYNVDGTPFRNRLRVAQLAGANGTRMMWDSNGRGLGVCLFGLNHLKTGPAEPILPALFVVEGESDWLTLHRRRYRALGLPGATNFASDKDDIHLDGEEVIYAVVEPGESGRSFIRALSRSRNSKKILLVRLDGIKDVSDLHIQWPDQFDEKLAAAIAEAKPLTDFLTENRDLDATLPVHERWLPEGFQYDGETGAIQFHSIETDKKTGAETEKWTFLCSPIECVGIARDGDGRGWSRRFLIKARDGRQHVVTVKMALLAGNAEEMRRLLLDHGADLSHSPAGRAKLVELVSRSRPQRWVQLVPTLGWFDRCFVLPDRVHGDAGGQEYVFDPAIPITHRFACGGTFEGWRIEIAARAIGNSRMLLAISASFTGPLLQLLNVEGGGFNLFGSSSTGKTSIARAAGATWGGGGPQGYLTSWRATANGLEGVAAIHNDGFPVLDEMGQIDAENAAQTAYMLANGQGKLRAGRGGEARPVLQWVLIFLSTAEITLVDKLQAARIRPMAGQEVRLIDIPVDAGASLGAFENLHGFSDAGAFADHLKSASTQHYGHAIRAFIERLASDLEGSREIVRSMMEGFVLKHCPKGADGQVQRAYRRFAIVAAAGELATAYGVVPWPAGEANRGVATCATAWLDHRGGVDSAEVLRGIANLRRFIQEHGTSRFADINMWLNRVSKQAGYYKQYDGGLEFMFHPPAFREACGGVDPLLVARALLRRGMLLPGEGNRLSKKMRLPRLNSIDGKSAHQARFYVVTTKLFDEPDEITPDESAPPNDTR